MTPEPGGRPRNRPPARVYAIRRSAPGPPPPRGPQPDPAAGEVERQHPPPEEVQPEQPVGRHGRGQVEGSDREIPTDYVFLAMGFTGPEKGSWLDTLGVEFDGRGNLVRDNNYASNVPGVFVAGDMGRGQSLIVWAIAEGRSAAAGVDRYLMGETKLPEPIPPTARPLM